MAVKLLNEQHLVSILKRRVHRLTCAYSCQNATLLEISCRSLYFKKLKRRQAIVEVHTVLRIRRDNVVVTKEFKLFKIEK